MFTGEAKSSDAGQNWFPQIKGELKAHKTYKAYERGKKGPRKIPPYKKIYTEYQTRNK